MDPHRVNDDQQQQSKAPSSLQSGEASTAAPTSLRRTMNFRKPSQNLVHIPETEISTTPTTKDTDDRRSHAHLEATNNNIMGSYTDQHSHTGAAATENDSVVTKRSVTPPPLTTEQPKMFFYYPKYLHPEAVALIAENLLKEWEQNDDDGDHNDRHEE